MGEQVTAAANPLDVHKDEFLSIARAFEGDDGLIRDRVALLVEMRLNVCARDSLRIAFAWMNDKPTPATYRAK